MFKVGDVVRILAPFDESFPETYEVTEVVTHGDDQVTYVLGEAGGFDAKYLELAE